MIKKLKVIFICALIAFSLTACGSIVESKVVDDQVSMFVIVEGDATSTWYIVYHKETKVMYAVSNGNSNRGIFTVLVNPDGTPMLWEEK